MTSPVQVKGICSTEDTLMLGEWTVNLTTSDNLLSIKCSKAEDNHQLKKDFYSVPVQFSCLCQNLAEFKEVILSSSQLIIENDSIIIPIRVGKFKKLLTIQLNKEQKFLKSQLHRMAQLLEKQKEKNTQFSMRIFVLEKLLKLSQSTSKSKKQKNDESRSPRPKCNSLFCCCDSSARK